MDISISIEEVQQMALELWVLQRRMGQMQVENAQLRAALVELRPESATVPPESVAEVPEGTPTGTDVPAAV